MDANECAKEIQLRNKNITPASKLMSLRKYAATISLSPVHMVLSRYCFSLISNLDDKLTVITDLRNTIGHVPILDCYKLYLPAD